MVYVATKVPILTRKLYQPYYIHIYHHACFDENNYCLSIEENHSSVYLLLQQYPEGFIHNLDIFNFLPFEPDITYTTFCVATITTYELELPPSGNKISFTL